MPSQFQLTMRSGPNPDTVFELDGDQISIGRDSSNEIPVNDAEISRRHSRLSSQGGKYVLEDLGSTNGTFVNGQRLTGQHVLKSGDVISLGEQIVFVYEAIDSDPGATVVTKKKKKPVVSRSAATPPPAPQDSAEAGSGKKLNPVPIAIIIGAVVLVCACIGFFWYVDSNFLWCTFFTFLGGC